MNLDTGIYLKPKKIIMYIFTQAYNPLEKSIGTIFKVHQIFTTVIIS